MSRGLFVTFEGVDGVGKTTLLKNVYAILKHNKNCIMTKEPGDMINGELIGSDLGPGIRQLAFFNPTSNNMAPGVCDLLFLADHIQVTEKVIKPALAEGKIVLCDRYADSQFAYAPQKNCPEFALRWYKEMFTLKPDLTFLVTCDPEKAWARSKARIGNEGTKQDGKVWKGVENQTQIQNNYLEQLSDQERTVIINMDEFEGRPEYAGLCVVKTIMDLNKSLELTLLYGQAE